MTFPINTAIPATNDNPADDQPLMQNNFFNIAGFLAVDHQASGSANAGIHTQMRTPSFLTTVQIAAVTPTAPAASTLFTIAGQAAPTFPQQAMITTVATYILSAVRAFGFITVATGSGPQVVVNGINVASVNRTGVGNYTVVLSSNVVSGGTMTNPNFSVFVSSNMASNFQSGVLPGYVITGANSFQLNFKALTGTSNGADPTNFCFVVLQY